MKIIQKLNLYLILYPFFNVIAFCHENFSFETLLLSSKTALLNDPNNYLTQIMKCYGHMYNQLFGSEELIAKNLGIALTHLPPNTALQVFADNSQINGSYKELSLQFNIMAEEQHIMASIYFRNEKKGLIIVVN